MGGVLALYSSAQVIERLNMHDIHTYAAVSGLIRESFYPLPIIVMYICL